MTSSRLIGYVLQPLSYRELIADSKQDGKVAAYRNSLDTFSILAYIQGIW